MKLLAVLAHPDDESLGFGGVLARYAAEGIRTCLVTATRGEAGRYMDGSDPPGPEALGRIREAELRAAARTLGIGEVRFLDYHDGRLDRADPAEATERIAGHIRDIRPHVVVTFGPDGAYGHPDHVAICQLTTAAVLVAGHAPGDASAGASPPHRVSKLYYMAWTSAKWRAYEAAFKRLVSVVDGLERHCAPWPDWAVTTVVDTADHWRTVWEAIQCHTSQIAIYGRLAELEEEHHVDLWGTQEFYRVLSTVNGGRSRETDLFEGLR